MSNELLYTPDGPEGTDRAIGLHDRPALHDLAARVAELAARNVFDRDGDKVVQRVRNRQPQEALDIIVPHAVLNQPAILPHRPRRATDAVERAGCKKDDTVPGGHG